jgi:hypothetical protein
MGSENCRFHRWIALVGDCATTTADNALALKDITVLIVPTAVSSPTGKQGSGAGGLVPIILPYVLPNRRRRMERLAGREVGLFPQGSLCRLG